MIGNALVGSFSLCLRLDTYQIENHVPLSLSFAFMLVRQRVTYIIEEELTSAPHNAHISTLT
jgi:hypothetical protein